MTPFGMVEQAVKQVIESTYEPAAGHTGGAPRPGGELYVWITLVSGSADELEGQWTLDIDCFSPKYAVARRHALALEAILLRPRHATEEMRLDGTTQNETPVERPWNDDSVSRVGATYTFTARRSG